MTLDTWMKGPPKWTNESLGSFIGVDPSWISQIRNKKVIPSLGMAKKISKFTDNKVTIIELLQLNKKENITKTKG